APSGTTTLRNPKLPCRRRSSATLAIGETDAERHREVVQPYKGFRVYSAGQWWRRHFRSHQVRQRDWGKGSADNIRANGRHDPHQQAEDMTAPTIIAPQ